MDSSKPLASTPNEKISGSFSNGVVPSEKPLRPIAPIWVPAPLGYHTGKSSVCRKLPESDQVEIEVTMSEDSSKWSNPSSLTEELISFIHAPVVFILFVILRPHQIKIFYGR